MKSNFANPAPLGLMGFATTTWLLVNTGWMPGDTIGAVLVMAFAFGGTAQFFAGILEQNGRAISEALAPSWRPGLPGRLPSDNEGRGFVER